jgi:hypothetical protein
MTGTLLLHKKTPHPIDIGIVRLEVLTTVFMKSATF